MKITYKGNAYVCVCSFSERLIPKNAGFKWHGDQKKWYTENHGVAARLLDHCDESAKIQIRKNSITVEDFGGALQVPDGLELFPFQIEGAYFSLARNRSYIAFDPGLGKTPIAAVIASTLGGRCAFVYVCPPFLTRNTEAEFNRWAPKLKVSRVNSDEGANRNDDVIIIPDSIVNRPMIQGFIKEFADHHKRLKREVCLIVDEAHRYKNDDAIRTMSIFGGTKTNSKTKEKTKYLGVFSLFDRVIFMSGTPMPNRPIELFSILHHAAPCTIDWMNKFQYARKFCDAKETGFGWDFNGASNLRLLKNRVEPFMLRKKKSEVLTQLPPKIEEMVLIGDNLPPKLAGLDREILKENSPHDLMEGKLALKLERDGLHLSTYRKELGIEKVKTGLEFIRYLLEETTESILIFAIHKEVIATLEKELADFKPLVITGSTPMAERHEIVKTFQQDESRRVFLGNIQAAGVGLTLTKATRVVFVEFDWVPGVNDQAADRAHRIGQVGNVMVQYLVFKNSVDRTVLEALLRKKKVTAMI